jgi:hypothetical protein
MAAIAAAEIRQMEARQGRQRTRVLRHSVIAKGSRSTVRSIPKSGIEPTSDRDLPFPQQANGLREALLEPGIEVLVRRLGRVLQ